ncbi:hypothetical protein BG011_007417 [Mortierella polycephala]|uniref:WRKY domain-containing protein n=1 Tax=Mortierella polycephala TaxID=41804 RepID=A0A9P6PR48_9FUNG|nr:hypothetical protein BG011_007417 [Mortierella polycephala]
MNPSSSSYGYLPYSSTSQVSSPGSQAQQTPQPQQQLGSVTSQQLSQELAQELASPPPPLSLHASSLQTSPTTVVSTSPTSPLSLSPGSISNNSCNSNGPNNNNNGTNNGSGTGHPTINTAILSSFGGMLPSPQHSSQGIPSTPTAGSILPTTPPQTADLDTILATYSSQPELLKLIIASKTEEDRRWAEEARFKMMDLIMRGENRNMALMTGYEGLLAQTVSGATTGTSVSSVSTGNMSSAGGAHPTATTTTTTTATTLGMASNGKRFMDDGYDNSTSGTSTALPAVTTSAVGNGIGLGSSNTVGGDGGGYGQGPDHGLSRKRSVTFARDMPHGHLRSQSMSSMPTASNLAGPPIPSTSSAFSSLSMMGLTGPNTALQQHHSQQHGSFQQAPPLTLQQQYQQQQHQFQQHQQLQHQAPHQQLPPPFGQYPQVFPYHGLSPLNHQQSHHHHQNVIRRTNSLSHLSHIAQTQHTTVMEPRLVAGRPRNDSATSFRTMDDSDEESDEDYSDHPVMGGMNSRPGSSLSMNNMMGGNGETSLTLHFSDLASVSGSSGLGPGSYQQQQQVSQSSIMSGLHHGVPSVMPMNMPGMGLGTVPSSGPGAGTGTGLRGRTGTNTSTTSADGAGGVDQKRKRKRREMQPVNKIVESPEPHVDQYLWKNNGNTTQKKTGCKSIYYKCSNSAGGCTVNKTVTEKEGGGYVTKYRGEHLEECIKIRRAQLAAQAAQAAQNAYSLQKEQ